MRTLQGFYVHPNARQAISAVSWFLLKPDVTSELQKPEATIAAWQECLPSEIAAEEAIEVSLRSLLLDSEVIYSRSASEAVTNIVRQHSASHSICAFGGPVPLDVPYYKSYLRETLACLKRADGPRFSVLSYIPQNEPDTSFAWLELCRRLAIRYSDRFAFSAFAIPEGQLRPFSFQIFDQTTVHLGLRSYSIQLGTPTMSAAIMIRNRNIAERLYGEYVENYRKIGAISEKTLGELVSGLQSLTTTTKRECMTRVEELLG
ncbi:MAG: hypothetical protein ACREIJ_08270 [Nitrospiraceae bacterium]